MATFNILTFFPEFTNNGFDSLCVCGLTSNKYKPCLKNRHGSSIYWIPISATIIAVLKATLRPEFFY